MPAVPLIAPVTPLGGQHVLHLEAGQVFRLLVPQRRSMPRLRKPSTLIRFRLALSYLASETRTVPPVYLMYDLIMRSWGRAVAVVLVVGLISAEVAARACLTVCEKPSAARSASDNPMPSCHDVAESEADTRLSPVPASCHHSHERLTADGPVFQRTTPRLRAGDPAIAVDVPLVSGRQLAWVVLHHRDQAPPGASSSTPTPLRL